VPGTESRVALLDALAGGVTPDVGAGSPGSRSGPYSSGAAFDGWRDLEINADSSLEWLAQARSWLLRVGWRRHGLLSALPVG
jgi:hypothetical protein